MNNLPNSLAHKRILIGISGGIAAYKIPELVRRLKDLGADVRCVMTQGAHAFITPLTLQAVSGNPVHHDLLDPAAEAAMGHIELAKWADLIMIAPASASVLAQLAHGHASDLLSTLVLATTAPIYVAPAMNQQMWANPAVQANCQRLQTYGIHIVAPASGAQACGDVGAGRMPEPLELRDCIVQHFAGNHQLLASKSILITAGPTREAIDPVRYLSNHSSGKMGFALATAAQQLGAQVTLVSGPVQLPTPPGVTRIDVVSAQDMYEAVLAQVEQADIFIGCAAVADYRPEQIADSKIKKHQDTMHLSLVKNPDILATVAHQPNPPFTIGFAAETDDVVRYAQDKLEQKRLRLIAANDVSDTQIGFNSDDNAMQLLWQDEQGQLQQLSLNRASKLQIATQLLQHAATLMK
ncbi:phosphopantothenoylcysteine decarboxylase / phosphopantothenate--cysteine ligase [Pseudidiomarina indica]|uniref:Coenzyme A biosynthesis bifunctional protein CoaBC n=1 Tax=Pseudidiomarina indica TaxID=1159017 RepID=A0A1G6CPL3_9GAMM|nr:bifunctional phosphopantothenoylcysteine decarboxylase/phosphopantothenate--cysteine ligase CoaBC [Pseudidiomarina indica]SDB34836.1 phosphopantothenoylcysteine decarboxylase / phosphopantothenate--cysteine ligase [Pseudidiomarina indica]